MNEMMTRVIRATLYQVRQFFGNMQATYNVIAVSKFILISLIWDLTTF